MRVALLIGGLAVGAAVAMTYRSKTKQSEPMPEPEHLSDADWSLAKRIAMGAAGGGLMLYGMRAKGKLARMASPAGAGMLARSVRDEPIHEIRDVINPRALLMI